MTPTVRSMALILSLSAAALATGCVIAPNADTSSSRAADVAKMSEQATTTCGAGNVKEVNAKSFSCK